MLLKVYWCLTVIKGQVKIAGCALTLLEISPAWIHEILSVAANNDSIPTAFSPWNFPQDSNAQIRVSSSLTLVTVSFPFSWGVCQGIKGRARVEWSKYSFLKGGVTSSKHKKSLLSSFEDASHSYFSIYLSILLTSMRRQVTNCSKHHFILYSLGNFYLLGVSILLSLELEYYFL